MHQPDIVIAGAGIIGLSLALEFDRRGLRVTVLEAAHALTQASTAAAGMLAVDDPANPAALHPLAALSTALYPEYLDRIETLSGLRVPFQTTTTLQAVAPGASHLDVAQVEQLVPQLALGTHRFALLDERSLDPRELAPALLAAVRRTKIKLLEQTPLARVAATETATQIVTGKGERLSAQYLVDCMGAWSPAPVAPVKGQMLSVELPRSMPLEAVIRTDDIYIVPRTQGANAGRALVGATLENAGFDKTVHPKDLLNLHLRAVALLPELTQAHFHESWSGLRPATLDGLPILGAVPGQPRYVLANGHFRNGILLAPATARAIAELLVDGTASVDLKPFAASRF